MTTNRPRRWGSALRSSIIAVLTTAALAAGCTSGDQGASDDTTATTATADSSSDATFASGPAPGVTDDSIKVGVVYVDLESLRAAGVLTDHGDYEAAYSALFDNINANGGINGRTIDYTILPDDTSAASSEAACTQLTEDEESFVILGFFLGDTVLCPLETHSTAVIGGVITAERLGRAQAPWYSNEGSEDLQAEAVRAMAEAGDLDGTVGVFGGPQEQVLMEDVILPLLDELGIDVAESAIVDQTADDIAATDNSTEAIAQRFETSGVDQVLALGTSSLAFVQGIAPSDYRPAVRFTEAGAITTYASGEGRDVSPLEGSIVGALYGGAREIYALDGMQECIGILEDAGIEVPEPPEGNPGDDQQWTSAFTSCSQVVLFQSLVEAAGEDLNYGSLAGASAGLEVAMPNQPEPLTFGPGEQGDGDPQAYLFDFDAESKTFVLQDGQ